MAYFRLLNESGKRERWTVKVSSDTLSRCCEERMEYHKGRHAFWSKQHADAESRLKTDGIQLKHWDVTGGTRMEAQLDPSLAKRVSECEGKMRTHKEALDRFLAFSSLLSIAEGPLELNADDVLYFNLQGADSGDDEDDG